MTTECNAESFLFQGLGLRISSRHRVGPRFHCFQATARSRRRIQPSKSRSSHGVSQKPKYPTHPRRYTVRSDTIRFPSTPRVRRVSSRTFSRKRFSAWGAIRRWGFAPSAIVKPRYFRRLSRSTALLDSWTFNWSRRVMKSLTLFITRCPAFSLPIPAAAAFGHGTAETSRGKFDRLRRTPAESTPVALDGYGLRGQAPARPTTNASIRFLSIRPRLPLPFTLPPGPSLLGRLVRRSRSPFRPRLAATPLRFARTSPPSGCAEDLHPQVVKHARHTLISIVPPGRFRRRL